MTPADLFRKPPLTTAEVASRQYKAMYEDLARMANEMDLQGWDAIVTAEIRRFAVIALRASRAEMKP